MSILLAAGLFAVIVVSGLIGMFLSGAMTFRTIGRIAPWMLVTGVCLAVFACTAVACSGDAIGWVCLALPGLIFGVMMPGEAQ